MVAGGLRQEPIRRKQVRFAAAELIENGRGARALRDCAIGCVRFCSSHPLCQVI